MSDQGHGIALSHDSGFYASGLRSVRWTGANRGEVDTTANDTENAKTNAPAELYDPGELQLGGFFNPAVQPALIAGDAAETATVTWTNAAGSTLAASGWMKSFEADGSQQEERVMFNAVIRLSGVITIVAAP